MYSCKNEGRKAFFGSTELKSLVFRISSFFQVKLWYNIFVNTLITKNLTAFYKDKLILNNISLNASSKEFICLCGPNGSGKSTLLSLLAGLPYDGLKITKAETLPQVNGKIISSLKRKECASLIAFMQQSEYSQWNFTVRDFVLQGRYSQSHNGIYTKEDYSTVDSLLAELNLDEFSERTIHTLSGGEFQKIRIARCLAQNPAFMLLDEPSSNLDYVYEPKLLEFLKTTAHTKNFGILIAIHNLDLARQFADKIMLLPPQKPLIQGEPREVMTKENLKITFGVELECRKTESFQLL